MRRAELALLVAAVSALLSAPAVPSGESTGHADGTSRRVVAVGDIHGADEAFAAILRRAELIDEAGGWAGGNAVLVQTGDFLDRGAGALRVASRLQRLQAEAEAAGGAVVVLLGNHEGLNLLGDLSDVTPEILVPLVDAESEARRETHCSAEVKRERRGRRDRSREKKLYRRCLDKLPPGELEYRLALRPEGELGAWLRSLPVAVRLGEVVFVHAGIGPRWEGVSLDDINRQAYDEIALLDRVRATLAGERAVAPTAGLRELVLAIRELDTGENPIDEVFRRLLGYRDWLLLDPQSPLWFRGYERWEDFEGHALLPRILGRIGASRVVVAHTPQETHQIASRFGERAFLIDTGMLESVYGGRPSALEIQGGRFTALYLDGEERLDRP